MTDNQFQNVSQSSQAPPHSPGLATGAPHIFGEEGLSEYKELERYPVQGLGFRV